MIEKQLINIGKDFSDHPIGRYRTDGSASGQTFCEDHLIPLILKIRGAGKIEVVLDDGVDGYGSSFLDEAFAGCVKKGHIQAENLLEMLEFKYEKPDFDFFEAKIRQYISEAEYGSVKCSCADCIKKGGLR